MMIWNGEAMSGKGSRAVIEKKVEAAQRELESMIVLQASKTIPSGLAALKVKRASLELAAAKRALVEFNREQLNAQ
jgi:hypothetical protein